MYLARIFIDQNIFSLTSHILSYLMTRDLTVVRQEVNYFVGSLVMQELELTMKLAPYGLLEA